MTTPCAAKLALSGGWVRGCERAIHGNGNALSAGGQRHEPAETDVCRTSSLMTPLL